MSNSTANPNDLPLHWTDYVENGSGYRTGGYAPIHIGDTFEGRYTVVHKLGHGGFATVWLARDHTLKRYVALKVIKASVTKSSEKALLRFLQERHSTHPGRQHIVPLLDVFAISSPNGVHECLVFEFRGPSVKSIDHESFIRCLHGKHVRKLCQQLLMAVDYVHSQKIVHADITPGNIMLGLKEGIHRCSTQQILDLIGHPEEIRVERHSGSKVPSSYPRYVVEAADLWGLASFMTANISLADFGEAFSTSNLPVRHGLGGIPSPFKAPELWFERIQGPAADVWAVGCCIHYLRFGFELVETMGGPNIAILDIASFLGPLPGKWAILYFDELRNAKPRSEFKRNKALGKVIGCGLFPEEPLEPEDLRPWPEGPVERPLINILRARSESVQSLSQIPKARRQKSKVEQGHKDVRVKLTGEEATSMADLLSRLLTWEPQTRASAHQLLNHGWFNNERFARDDLTAVSTNSLLQVDIKL